MNWAAITYTLLLFVGFVSAMCKHGQPRQPYNAVETQAACVLTLFLLWQAGFFQ